MAKKLKESGMVNMQNTKAEIYEELRLLRARNTVRARQAATKATSDATKGQYKVLKGQFDCLREQYRILIEEHDDLKRSRDSSIEILTEVQRKECGITPLYIQLALGTLRGHSARQLGLAWAREQRR